jgi:hypothetical protein
MTRAELRYAIGAEVAHLRYGHARVTSSEVWAGALSKSKQGLDFALGVLPMLKGMRFADKISRVFSKIPLSAARRVLDGAGSISGRMRSGLMIVPSPRPTNDGVLSRINEELVAAHPRDAADRRSRRAAPGRRPAFGGPRPLALAPRSPKAPVSTPNARGSKRCWLAAIPAAPSSIRISRSESRP